MARHLISSDLSIKHCKPKEKTYRLNDGGGLCLLINPDNSKYWRYNYTYQGKRKTLSLGTYPKVSLKKARDKVAEFDQHIADDIDPSQIRKENKQAQNQTIENEKRLAAGIPLKDSLTDIANRWLNDYRHTVSPATFQNTQKRIERYLTSKLGNMPVTDIKASHIREIALFIANDQKAIETSHRVLTDCNRIFKYAIAHDLIEYDPSYAVKDALPAVKVTHRAAITDPRQIGQLMRDIYNYDGTFVVQCALKITPLIFSRPGEIRQMEWKDVDLEANEWRYFVTKTSSEHIVPLSTQAVEILKMTQTVTGSAQYVFPSIRSDHRPMSENTVRLALRAMGYDKDTMSAHGFRTTASTLLNEQGWSADAIERQLAHAPRNKVRAAYNRAQYLDERKRMMQSWADYLDSLRSGADIVPIHKAG